jgi:SAM-dependent methyltransferase
MHTRGAGLASSKAEQIAACPACHGDLDWHADHLRCVRCARTYGRAAGGAPILLLDDAPAVEEVWYPGARRLLPFALRRAVDRHRRLLCPALTYRSGKRRELVAEFVEAFPAGATIANVGGGTRDYGPKVANIDIEPLPETDVVGVAEQLPIADASCDGAILQAVLEHVQSADRSLQELRRVLKPNGLLFVEVPFMQGYHPDPGDYRRFTEQGLRAELADHGFEVEDSGVAVGPGSAMAWVTAEFLAFLVSGRSESIYRIARPVCRLLALPIKYTDLWLDTHPLASTLASGVWARARRGD